MVRGESELTTILMVIACTSKQIKLLNFIKIKGVDDDGLTMPLMVIVCISKKVKLINFTISMGVCLNSF